MRDELKLVSFVFGLILCVNLVMGFFNYDTYVSAHYTNYGYSFNKLPWGTVVSFPIYMLEILGGGLLIFGIIYFIVWLWTNSEGNKNVGAKTESK